MDTDPQSNVSPIPEETPETTPERPRATPSAPKPKDPPAETTKIAPPRDEARIFYGEAAKAYRSKDYASALEFVSKAEALKPENKELLILRGAIYAESGKHAEAIEVYQKVLAEDPKSFPAAFNLAEVFFMQKNFAEARSRFEKLREAAPNHEMLRLKIMLTHLLEGNDTAAKAELDQFKFPSDTAAREFAMAAWDFAHGNVEAGKDWVASGERIFGRQKTEFLYQILADLNWVPSPRPEKKR